MKVNYHTHTERCNHAHGSDEEFALSAIKGGFKEIGFSDHTPWPYTSSYQPHMRMQMKEYDGYLESINSLKVKYQDQISIRLGLECEYFPEYLNWLKQQLDEGIIEYAIFGNHFHLSDETGEYFGNCSTAKSIDTYYDDLCKGMETGLFSYVAHPDLFMKNYLEFDKHCEDVSYKICKKAKEMDMILEYNLCGAALKEFYGREVYPRQEFWKIASVVGCKVIIGVDAHELIALEDDFYYKEAIRFLSESGCEIVEKIPLYKDLKNKR